MKKVLIAVSQLRVGGVSKALIELFKNVAYKYDVTLLCFDHMGAFYEDIPKNVKVIEDNPYLALTERSANEVKTYGNKYKLLRQVGSAWTRCFGKAIPAKYICHKVGHIRGNYDIAIAFGHPQKENLLCNLAGEIVLNCVNSKKKIIVIHCDYQVYGGHCKCNDDLLLQFDQIAAVSRSVGEAIVKCIPKASSKVCTLRNFHDFDLISKMANENPVDYPHKHTLVTVARLSEEKGLLQGVEIINNIRKDGYDIGWYIVGAGPLKVRLEQVIEEKGANGYIFLEGEQINPYRYIKNANYLFVPSFHEAAPMVFDEAASLNVPIISTNTLSASEFVEEKNIGYVGKLNQMVEIIEEALINQEQNREKMKAYIPNNTNAMNDFEILCSS